MNRGIKLKPCLRVLEAISTLEAAFENPLGPAIFDRDSGLLHGQRKLIYTLSLLRLRRRHAPDDITYIIRDK